MKDHHPGDTRSHFPSIFLPLLCLLLPNFGWAQTVYVPPDLWGEKPSVDHEYIVNQGQLRDTDGNTAGSVDFFTRSRYPLLYFSEDVVSYAYRRPGDPEHNIPDKVFRLDMEFVCPEPESNCGSSPIPVGPNSHYYNYYTSQVPSGLTNVPTYNRLVYEEVWTGIDVHYFSNAAGPKIYFVVHDNGNPDDILFQFSGQDSIVWDSNAGVDVYLGAKSLKFEQALAYEVDEHNETTLLGWQPEFAKNGNNEVFIETGYYSPGSKLVIMIGHPVPPGSGRNVDAAWATYLGGAGEFEMGNSMAVRPNGDVFVTGSTGSPNFPVTLGAFDPSFNNNVDAYVMCFNEKNQRKWATYVGGDFDDFGEGIDHFELGSTVTVLNTTSPDMQKFCPTGTFCEDYSDSIASTIYDLFIIQLDSSGQREWATYFGSVGNDKVSRPNPLDIDNSGRLRIVGQTEALSAFPTVLNGNPNAFFQGIRLGPSDGFIAQFSASTAPGICGAQDWTSFFGSGSADAIHGIASNSNNDFYVHGTTSSLLVGDTPCQASGSNAGFPLCDPVGNSDYYQTIGGGGFISRFNASGELTWSTFWGGDNVGSGSVITHRATGITIDQTDNLLVTGSTPSNGSSTNCVPPNAVGEFPMCDPGGSSYFESVNKGNRDGYIAKFNSNNSIVWSTLIGGENDDFFQSVKSDGNGTVYTVGQTYSQQFPTIYRWGMYFQSGLSDQIGTRSDAFISAFDSNLEQRWSTYYGGGFTPNSDLSENSRLSEIAHAVTTSPDGSVYMTGLTNSFQFPTACASSGGTEFCRKVFDLQAATGADELDDAFVVKFNGSNVVGINKIENAIEFELFPNPSIGQLHYSIPPSDDLVQVQVLDMLGKIIYSGEISPSGDSTIHHLDLSDQADGIYHFMVATEHANAVRKFVLIK